MNFNKLNMVVNKTECCLHLQLSDCKGLNWFYGVTASSTGHSEYYMWHWAEKDVCAIIKRQTQIQHNTPC